MRAWWNALCGQTSLRKLSMECISWCVSFDQGGAHALHGPNGAEQTTTEVGGRARYCAARERSAAHSQHTGTPYTETFTEIMITIVF